MTFFSAQVLPNYEEISTLRKESSTIELGGALNDIKIFSIEFGKVDYIPKKQYEQFIAGDIETLEFDTDKGTVALTKDKNQYILYIAKYEGNGFGEITIISQTDVIIKALKAYINS